MQSNYTLSKITDLEELAVSLTKHYEPEQTLEQSRDILAKHFEFGYKCTEGDSVGFCYILKASGMYMIDASNEGLRMFTAFKLVKTVINEALDKVTDCVLCGYNMGDTESAVIRKRLGFKFWKTVDCLDLFFIKRE